MMREVSRLLRGQWVICAGLALGGCSVSVPIASLVKDDETVTGSVSAKAVSPLSAELGAEDWRRAKGALAIALDPQGNGSSVNWDNAETGMKGTFVPVGQPFVKSDEMCCAFLATVIGQAATASLQGTACRPSGGEWAIKGVKPWKKPA
jgi:surface antigen